MPLESRLGGENRFDKDIQSAQSLEKLNALIEADKFARIKTMQDYNRLPENTKVKFKTLHPTKYDMIVKMGYGQEGKYR